MNFFSFNDYGTLERFRAVMKHARWEASRSIAISVPLVQLVHAPPVGGWRPSTCSGYAYVLRDRFLWQDYRNLSKPYTAFSRTSMTCPPSSSMIRVSQAEANDILASAISNEQGKGMTASK